MESWADPECAHAVPWHRLCPGYAPVHWYSVQCAVYSCGTGSYNYIEILIFESIYEKKAYKLYGSDGTSSLERGQPYQTASSANRS